ncbi:hypothetical protein [Thiococcus pfennigii]|uniref:hypothetical protein n=1 Tax=Thiococcus pfennigii TaxID=1057 RepID=UPI00190727C0|nr:hypothetical protein [Thiococcus pfennigii]
MGPFAAGQIVVLPFPFSDLTARKYRPALLLAAVGRGDWIVCQITSNAYGDRRAVALRDEDFSGCGLDMMSYAVATWQEEARAEGLIEEARAETQRRKVKKEH